MPELTPFQLWSQGAWPTREVVGEAYRNDSIRTLFPSRRLSGGHDLDKTARLVPEPRNPHDANAVAVVVDNVLVGYLARDEAAKYQRVLLDLNRAGLDATVPCTIHGYEYEETDYDRRGRPVTSITFQAQPASCLTSGTGAVRSTRRRPTMRCCRWEPHCRCRRRKIIKTCCVAT